MQLMKWHGKLMIVSNREFQEMLFSAPSLPSKQEAFSYIEAINPDSLHDAFEVEEDGIERIYRGLRG